MRIVVNTALRILFYFLSHIYQAILFPIFYRSVLHCSCMFGKRKWKEWEMTFCVSCHLASGLIKIKRGDIWINSRSSHSQGIFFGQGLDVISVNRHLPTVRRCYTYRKKKLFSFLASFFSTPVGNAEKWWAVTFLSEAFWFYLNLKLSWLWESGTIELGLDLVGGREFKPLDSTWTLPKVAHFSCQATKSTQELSLKFHIRRW